MYQYDPMYRGHNKQTLTKEAMYLGSSLHLNMSLERPRRYYNKKANNTLNSIPTAQPSLMHKVYNYASTDWAILQSLGWKNLQQTDEEGAGV